MKLAVFEVKTEVDDSGEKVKLSFISSLTNIKHLESVFGLSHQKYYRNKS